MLFNQFILGFRFYFIFTLFAGIGLLATKRIFSGSSAAAWFVAKPLGLAFFAYVIWLLGSLRILDYQNNLVIVSLFISAIVVGFVLSFKNSFKNFSLIGLYQSIKNILLLELASVGLYFGYLWIRSYNAAAYGTERFMDMALLNSSLKADYFSFVDPWYAGKVVNYYYYGHYLMSVITKLSNISSFLTYSYALALLYTVAFILVMILVYQLCHSKTFALLGGFLVTTAGSMFYSGCVIDTWLKGQAICSYASSTRLYTPSYIINEIPSYSFTVGDLHAHFLALPFFLLNLLLIYAFIQAPSKIIDSSAAGVNAVAASSSGLISSRKVPGFIKSVKPQPALWLSLLAGFVTSALINPSDVTTLGLVLFLAWAYKIYIEYKKFPNVRKFVNDRNVLWLISGGLFVSVGALILYLPFLLNFKSPVLGFGFVPTFAMAHNLWLNGHQAPTPLLALLGMWGVFVILIAFGLYHFKKTLKDYIFEIICFATAIFLIIFVELFYVKDIYHIANPPYFRANTVFKYGYHTWTLLCVAFAAILARLFAKLSSVKKYKPAFNAALCLLAIFVGFSLVYPYQAISQYYLSSPAASPTLDASAFMEAQSPGDLDTVNWINQNIKTRQVILEAVGDSYTYYARMSVFTGNITPMGWKTHEWTWRFDGAAAEKILAKNPGLNVETGYGAVSTVAADVALIYNTSDVEQARQLLKSYGVNYVYVGNQERTAYPEINELKFYQLGTPVFRSGSSVLFKVN